MKPIIIMPCPRCKTRHRLTESRSILARLDLWKQFCCEQMLWRGYEEA